MAWKHPLKGVVEQAFHGLDLLPPRVPAIIRRCIEACSVLVPVQVIPGKKELAAIEQAAMSACVPRRRYHEEVRCEGYCIGTSDHDFCFRLRTEFIFVDDSVTLEMFGKLCCVSDIVAMAQEDVAYASQSFKGFYERVGVTWRVD